MPKPLIDRYGRVHCNMRLSVTDRCNIRCIYCMPADKVQFKPREELLTFEEIERIVRIAARLGITRIRITGGEPLVRTGLANLVRRISSVPGIRDLAMTTNGMLLPELAADLKTAGLKRLNISLDTLNEASFERITRRQGLDRVLAGIFTAREAGFESIRLNAVAVRGFVEKEMVPLVQFARQHDLTLRFIEFMPLNATGQWKDEDVLTGKNIRAMLEQAFCPLIPVARVDPNQPSVDYRFADGQGRIGLITPVSQPFCGQCNRLRLTAEGQFQNCLFSNASWDARSLLRGNRSEESLIQMMRDCVGAKQPGHGIGEEHFSKPEKAMHEIGG
jgi:GTP 3',8-cyclase